MIGVFVNVLTVLVGSAIGLVCRRGIPERITDAVMTGIGLCTVYIGIDGALSGDNALVAIISMALGAIIGTLLDIDGAINRLGHCPGLRHRQPAVLRGRHDGGGLPERGPDRRQ